MSTAVYISFRGHLNRSKEFVRNTNRSPDTPYTTIYHRDLWAKNIMIKKGIFLPHITNEPLIGNMVHIKVILENVIAYSYARINYEKNLGANETN